MAFDERRVAELIRELYRVSGELEKLLGRPMTLDGHVVGSIAEAHAARLYGLQLNRCSTPGHDATGSGCKIEIKATQAKKISLRSKPEKLLAFLLHKDGRLEEIYNGPGEPVWKQATLSGSRNRPSNGQYTVSLAQLRQLMSRVPEDEKIKARPEVG